MSELLFCVLLVLAAEEASPLGAKALFDNPRSDALNRTTTTEKIESRRTSPEKKGDSAPERSSSDDEVVVQRASAPLPLGVRYWVRTLDDAGRTTGEVQAGRVFRNGERIQILAESNCDGYLVVLHIGSDGTSGLLFPSAEHQLNDNRVIAHQKVILPGPRHFFRFDQQPGMETLVLVLSRDRSDLEALRLGTKMERQLVEAVRAHGERERGSKNLLVEELPETSGDPRTYAVLRSGGLLVQELALVHKP
jgi:Domain of unknown function (DUF4384)